LRLSLLLCSLLPSLTACQGAPAWPHIAMTFSNWKPLFANSKLTSVKLVFRDPVHCPAVQTRLKANSSTHFELHPLLHIPCAATCLAGLLFVVELPLNERIVEHTSLLACC
jgi:hypothetical protein